MLDNLAEQSGACRLASSQGSTTLTKHCDVLLGKLTIVKI